MTYTDDAWRAYDAIEARLTAPVSERMLDLAALEPGMAVIDLASGRGEPALRAARRVAPGGFVLGVDLSDTLLAMARQRARDEGITNIELRALDAETLDGIPDASFDAATARWCLMYMGAPLRALARAHDALEPGAVLVAAFWAEPERVPWATLPRRALAPHRAVPPPDQSAPGAFHYADLSRIERDFSRTGFAVEHVEEIDIPVIEAESGAGIARWVRDLGLVRAASGLTPAQQAAWEADIAREAEQLRVGDTVRLGGVTRLVVGRKAR